MVMKKTAMKPTVATGAVSRKKTAAKPETARKTTLKKATAKAAATPRAVSGGNPAEAADRALVGIVMGSTSDWDVMMEAAKMCREFGIAYEARALSAHRSPAELEAWIQDMEKRGCQAFIAGAGGAAHLAGVVAAQTILPTFGVPMPSKYMKGLDSLLATVQMPKGIPVPTMAIGEAGAANAALAVVAMMALTDPALREKLLDFRARQSEKVSHASLPELE